jgi:hypothetical protein
MVDLLVPHVSTDLIMSKPHLIETHSFGEINVLENKLFPIRSHAVRVKFLPNCPLLIFNTVLSAWVCVASSKKFCDMIESVRLYVEPYVTYF